MLRDKAIAYYQSGMNCAESMLLAINDEYKLGIDKAQVKLVSGFGGGMGCEDVCGALTGAVAALGPMVAGDSAHNSPGLGAVCADWVKTFEKDLGSTNCTRLKELYRDDQTRCQQTVALAAASFEKLWQERQKG